jgi:carbonic anhydrase/acetyltransferase-like protein (isoleucine patch superfamily)
MKENSGAATGLTVITGNHQRKNGFYFKQLSMSHEIDVEKDVIVEEDVWLGANVTLLSGVTIGRGATVAAGSVCIKSVPPYAIVLGNPAKVIGFNYGPQEIIEHEKSLYSEHDRLPLDLLERNYKRYFLERAEEIKHLIK